jgi:hypothetical protein
MATLKLGTFSTYELSSRETLSGGVLNTDQKNLFQNLLAEAAESRLALDYSPEKPLEFAQNEAFLKGQIQLLKYLLDNSDACEKQLRSLAEVN